MSLNPTSPSSFASGLEYGLHQCTLPGLVVCGVLILLSAISWVVMLAKLYLLRRARKANVEFLQLFRYGAHPLAVFQSTEHFDRSPYYHIYYSTARELAYQLVGVDQPDKTFATRMQGAGRINASQMGAVVNVAERAVAEAALKFESGMGVVSTALGGAPFIGLLGTLWALLDSFALLAKMAPGSATVQVLAPGICAALLPTLAGLLVAVPSLFGYNFLVGRIRAMVVRLDNFASELTSIFDRHFVDHRATGDVLPSLGAMGSPTLPAFSSGLGTGPLSRASRAMGSAPSTSSAAAP